MNPKTIQTCLVATMLVGGLAACQSQSKPVGQMSRAEMQELAGEIAARCLRSGAKKDSPAMDACIRQESRREIATRAR